MFVLDTSSLIGLLDSDDGMFEAWRRADAGDIDLVIPALAIVEVAGRRNVSATAWAPILWPERVRVAVLSGVVAVEVGYWRGPLAARQALWESRSLSWPILTDTPDLYGPDALLIAF